MAAAGGDTAPGVAVLVTAYGLVTRPTTDRPGSGGLSAREALVHGIGAANTVAALVSVAALLITVVLLRSPSDRSRAH